MSASCECADATALVYAVYPRSVASGEAVLAMGSSALPVVLCLPWAVLSISE